MRGPDLEMGLTAERMGEQKAHPLQNPQRVGHPECQDHLPFSAPPALHISGSFRFLVRSCVVRGSIRLDKRLCELPSGDFPVILIARTGDGKKCNQKLNRIAERVYKRRNLDDRSSISWGRV